MKLYVGNLSFGTTGDDLEELFGQVGTVQSANGSSSRSVRTCAESAHGYPTRPDRHGPWLDATVCLQKATRLEVRTDKGGFGV